MGQQFGFLEGGGDARRTVLNPSGGRSVASVDKAQASRLPASRRSDEGVCAARLQRERDVPGAETVARVEQTQRGGRGGLGRALYII